MSAMSLTDKAIAISRAIQMQKLISNPFSPNIFKDTKPTRIVWTIIADLSLQEPAGIHVPWGAQK